MTNALHSGGVDHWYTFDGVTVGDLADLCRDLSARIIGGKLLVLFESIAARDAFERRCAGHKHAAVRKITRVVEVKA